MPYVPDPANVAEPISGRAAGTAAAEFRALKAVVAGLVLTAAGAPQVRQAVQSAVLDANGYNAALTVGAGLRPGLAATVADSLHLNFAGGFIGGKPIDTPEVFSANVVDILGADLPLNNTSYLYRDYGVQWGKTLIPPQDGYTFDRTRASLLGFQGLNGAITTTDDIGNAWVFSGNAQITTAQFKFGTSSLLLDGAGDYVTTADIKSVGDSSWEMALWFRINALPTAGNRTTLISSNAGAFGVQLELFNNAGTTKLELALSSNGTAQDIAALVVGINTVWALNQWNRVRLVFDALAGTYRIYLSLNGVLETQDLNVASAAKICALTQLRLGADSGAGSGWNGWLGNFRFLRAATNTTVEVPSAVAPTVTDYSINFFSIPKMTLYEVTAASAAANVNPTLTARTRLFVGEADTSGAAVTAIRNYAIRGQYLSADTVIPALSTRTAFNTNMGTILVRSKMYFRNITAEISYTPGMVMEAQRGHAAFTTYSTAIESRNVMSYVTGDAGAGSAGDSRTSGANSVITLANWKMFLEVQRAY